MIVLYIGGVKSGKSRHAETKALELSEKPLYLATSEIFDKEMEDRVVQHQADREKRFILIEEPRFIVEALKDQKGTVLIECITLWINNMLYYGYTNDLVLEQLERLLQSSNDLIIVQNDVGSGIIGNNALSRKFIDLSGIISQKIAAQADEVYHCIAGIATRIK